MPKKVCIFVTGAINSGKTTWINDSGLDNLCNRTYAGITFACQEFFNKAKAIRDTSDYIAAYEIQCNEDAIRKASSVRRDLEEEGWLILTKHIVNQDQQETLSELIA
jgi:hypothetical protein